MDTCKYHRTEKKIIGLLLFIEVHKSKSEVVSELWNTKCGKKNVHDIMSRNRFKSTLHVIRFDNASETRKSDKLEPIRESFDLGNSYLEVPYIPNWSMTFDEKLVTYRGKCSFWHYVIQTLETWLKLWDICDSVTSFVWKFKIYTQKCIKGISSRREVKRLTTEIENSGRNITCYNFFLFPTD